MDTKIVKRDVGRPTKYSEVIVDKLEEVFKLGGTIEQACAYAGIDKGSYYKWIELYKDFSTRIERAKHFTDIVAKRNINVAINEKKDLETSKWWLEKREFKYGDTYNVSGEKVIAILGGASLKDLKEVEPDSQK